MNFCAHGGSAGRPAMVFVNTLMRISNRIPLSRGDALNGHRAIEAGLIYWSLKLPLSETSNELTSAQPGLRGRARPFSFFGSLVARAAVRGEAKPRKKPPTISRILVADARNSGSDLWRAVISGAFPR